jgi:hypothetical protein
MHCATAEGQVAIPSLFDLVDQERGAVLKAAE